MFKSILIEMRRRIRTGHLILPIHAREEMISDHLTTDDVKHGILQGQIVERQWDQRWRNGNTSSLARPLTGVI
ncbi:MAG: DUF4258 domain-containing protein [Acidobacteriota bacterium]|nr:DUF4258 domain-containing protein [Acidobacteriota bacterium]